MILWAILAATAALAVEPHGDTAQVERGMDDAAHRPYWVLERIALSLDFARRAQSVNGNYWNAWAKDRWVGGPKRMWSSGTPLEWGGYSIEYNREQDDMYYRFYKFTGYDFLRERAEVTGNALATLMFPDFTEDGKGCGMLAPSFLSFDRGAKDLVLIDLETPEFRQFIRAKAEDGVLKLGKWKVTLKGVTS